MAELLALISITIIPKNYIDMDLTVGLSYSEFKCHCHYSTCHYTLVSKKLISSYKNLRIDFDKPLTINSGYRCQIHNEEIGGTDASSHTTGHAIDISTKDFTEEEKDFIVSIAKKYFDFVKVYKSFIHCQING